jgi:hypothetical protein
MGVPSDVSKIKRGVSVCVSVCLLATIDSLPDAADDRRNEAELQWLLDK